MNTLEGTNKVSTNHVLFFDTETTGFVRKNIPANDPSQARVCQLAAMLCDHEGNELGRINRIIRPDGWYIPDRVAQIHGITTQRAEQEGVPVADALLEFSKMSDIASIYVAHNFKFDNDMMEIESFNTPTFVWRPTTSYCTMMRATDVCKIPATRGSGYKWPKLMEIYKHLFGEEFSGAHDAFADMVAMKRVYFELKKLGY